MSNSHKLSALVNLFHEIGMLAHTPRSGFAFLGTGKQSVAEHSYRMALIALFLAEHAKLKVDPLKLLKICLLHDLPEARTGDQNYVNKRYVQVDINKAIQELHEGYPCGEGIASALRDYEADESPEAALAHEADKLEMLLVLKCESDQGNPRALEWFEVVAERLQSELARDVAAAILSLPSDAWWRSLAAPSIHKKSEKASF